MSQHYSDPARASDPHALPNIEVFYQMHAQDAAAGWYWHACFPGCLPDGDPSGPFETEAEAIADAQSATEVVVEACDEIIASIKYRFQVCLDKGTERERWSDVHPVGGKPYEYATRAEAENMARIYYGSDPSIVRVVEVQS